MGALRLNESMGMLESVYKNILFLLGEEFKIKAANTALNIASAMYMVRS
jgi:hypothetical protein